MSDTNFILDEATIENYRATIEPPIAYLMENDESKWLGWEPDYQGADRVTPLYKEKWKVAK